MTTSNFSQVLSLFFSFIYYYFLFVSSTRLFFVDVSSVSSLITPRGGVYLLVCVYIIAFCFCQGRCNYHVYCFIGGSGGGGGGGGVGVGDSGGVEWAGGLAVKRAGRGKKINQNVVYIK